MSPVAPRTPGLAVEAWVPVRVADVFVHTSRPKLDSAAQNQLHVRREPAVFAKSEVVGAPVRLSTLLLSFLRVLAQACGDARSAL